MADHPLRPANHRSLGRPLPHLLANGTQTPLRAVAYSEATFPCKTYEKQEYPVLVHLSAYYSRREDRLSTRYSPVRHFTQDRSPFRVRLACVKHAASVRSEPGSNSPVNILASHYDWTFCPNQKNYLARSFTVQFSKIKTRHQPGCATQHLPRVGTITRRRLLCQELILGGSHPASHHVTAGSLKATGGENTKTGGGCQSFFCLFILHPSFRRFFRTSCIFS